MARVSLTTGQIVRTGLVINPTAPNADGDIIDAGATALYVENVGAAAITVTVAATATQDGLDVVDQVVSVPAGGVRLLGPWPLRTFGQPADGADGGRVYVNYTTPADVRRQVVKF